MLRASITSNKIELRFFLSTGHGVYNVKYTFDKRQSLDASKAQISSKIINIQAYDIYVLNSYRFLKTLIVVYKKNYSLSPNFTNSEP